MAQKMQKAKYWTCVLYPESMIDVWEDKISDILQVPYCYIIHDKDNLGKVIKKVSNKCGKEISYDASEFCIDKHDFRKVHVHVVIAFPNTTTYKHALSCFQLLQPNCSYCEQVLNIRYMYEYLIHNTEKAKKDKKYQYDASNRICGNNFDIGAYEQVSITDKRKMLKELCDFIRDNEIDNFLTFYDYFDKKAEFDFNYFEVVASYSGLLERLCKGNYLMKYRTRKDFV